MAVARDIVNKARFLNRLVENVNVFSRPGAEDAQGHQIDAG